MTDPQRTADRSPAGRLIAGLDPTLTDRPLYNPKPSSLVPVPVDPPLFANTKPSRPRAVRPPRWRDEDMPLRPGDVIAVGLTHRNCPVGQVAAVNDHCFRLNLYNWTAEQFNQGTVIVGWSQVVEFGPVAKQRGAAWLMQVLRDFQTGWTENNR